MLKYNLLTQFIFYLFLKNFTAMILSVHTHVWADILQSLFMLKLKNLLGGHVGWWYRSGKLLISSASCFHLCLIVHHYLKECFLLKILLFSFFIGTVNGEILKKILAAHLCKYGPLLGYFYGSLCHFRVCSHLGWFVQLKRTLVRLLC